MAAVNEETTALENEKTAEEIKATTETAPETDLKPDDTEAPKAEEQEEKTNGHPKEEEKPESDQKPDDKALGATVAKHYNEHPEGTKDSRKESRIFHMRNFNNWVKSVIINEFLHEIKRFNYRNIHVLDLCCGKGGDLLKWQKGRIRKLVCADIAQVSVDQCKDRYKEMKKTAEERRYRDPLFDTQFIVADCSKERLAEKYEEKDLVFDLTSCQFSFHYSFESYEQADMMLKNACERLKPGGYFIGTTTNAYELVKRIKQAEGLEFGNEVYQIKFESKDSFPLYGCKYHFQLEDAVDCPEFLLYFPVLEKMAKKYSMKLIYAKPFHEFFKDRSHENIGLLSKMNALETYPVRREGDKLISSSEESYSHAKDFVDGLQSAKSESSSRYRDHRDRRDKHVGTLTKEEWEAVGMYVAFAFVKVDKIEDDPPKTVETPKKDGESSSQDVATDGTPADATPADATPKETPAEVPAEASTEPSVEEPTKDDATESTSNQEVATESRKRKHDEGAEEDSDEPPSKKPDETE